MAPDEREQDEPDERDEPSDAERVAAVAEQRGRRLQGGPSFGFFGGALPWRALIAAGIFVAVFLGVWALLWGLGVGLGLGWLPALAAGAGGVWLYAERFDRPESSRRDPAA
jgi:hypothetical protein